MFVLKSSAQYVSEKSTPEDVVWGWMDEAKVFKNSVELVSFLTALPCAGGWKHESIVRVREVHKPRYEEVETL